MQMEKISFIVALSIVSEWLSELMDIILADVICMHKMNPSASNIVMSVGRQ